MPSCRVLVNNAGGARGLEPIAEADEENWRWMWETNVLGTLRLTKALLPTLAGSGDGHVVTVTSIAAYEVYDNGAGYTSAKHAQSALHRTLRGEHLGQPIRFTEILPGMVETEFSLARFDGDEARADAVYAGITPLTAADVADTIVVRGDPAVAREHRPDRAQAARPGLRDPRPPRVVHNRPTCPQNPLTSPFHEPTPIDWLRGVPRRGWGLRITGLGFRE